MLEVNQERRADAQLQVGALTDRVEVTAPIADVRRDSPAVGTVVENRQILDMPLDGRNFLELTLLAPGTVPAAQGSAGSVRGDFSFSVNGGREDFNSFLLDGADNVDPKLNTTGVQAAGRCDSGVRSAHEHAGGGARAPGGVANQRRDEVGHEPAAGHRLYVHPKRRARRDELLRADRNEPDPEYQRTQSGFSIGGPIVRDRTFFFADYEGTRADEGITRISTVPTDAARNALPASLTHPVGRAIAALYPSPNRSGAGRQLRGVADAARSHRSFRRAQRHRVRRRVRSDGALQLRRSAAVRAVQRSRVFVAAGLRQRRRAARPEFRRERDAHLVAESAERDARRLQSRVGRACFPKRAAPSIATSACPSRGPIRATRGSASSPSSGYSPLGHEYNNPQSGTTNTIHVADTLTWTRGNHLVKAGFDARLIRAGRVPRRAGARHADVHRRVHRKPARRSVCRAADVHDARRALDNPQRLRTESYAWFVQDSYRIRPNVTLSAGLRYDLTSPPVDVEDRATLYDPQTGALAAGGHGRPAARRLRRPIATTGRRASAPRGRSTTRRRRSCAARTASTTTTRRSRRAKGCISARRISASRRTSRRRSGW